MKKTYTLQELIEQCESDKSEKPSFADAILAIPNEGRESDFERSDITTVYKVSQAKRRLTGLIRKIQRGEEIIIERSDGYRVMLSPADLVEELANFLDSSLEDVERSLEKLEGSVDDLEDAFNADR